MSERHFFDRLRQKIAALRPTETHKADDWAMLSNQLDTVLPQKDKRRVLPFLPFLLGISLLATNILWWWAYQQNSVSKAQAEAQVKACQNDLVTHEQQLMNLRDTITHLINNRQNTYQNKDTQPINLFETKKPNILTQQNKGVKNGMSYLIEKNTEQPTQKLAQTSIVETVRTTLSNTKTLEKDTNLQAKSENVIPIYNIQMLEKRQLNSNTPNNHLIIINPIAKSIAFKPRFQMGISTEYIRPYSTGLKAETGIGYNIEAGLGLSKHWQLMGSMGMMFLNYTATDKEAILGSAEGLPTIVNNPNNSTQMHMKNQGCMRYDLNLRYLFNPIKTIKPFIGWGISGMKMQTSNMDLEVQDMMNMMVHQSNIQINPQAHKLQFYRFNAGFELPLSQHFALGLEAYYMRQWNKTEKLAPDFKGLKSSIQYKF
jgi:Outer membrane protein beta-barrel domain